MAGNDGMESTFGRIKLRKFVGFDNQSGQKKKTVGSSSLEKDEKNDQTLPVDNKQKNQIFHPHGSH